LIRSSNSDSVGNAGSWNFTYLSESEEIATDIRIDMFANQQEELSPFEYVNFFDINTIENLEQAADAALFLANTEPAGGSIFRNQAVPNDWEFELELVLGDLRNSSLFGLVIDSAGAQYWGASYRFYRQLGPDDWELEDEMLFLGDFLTGDLLIVTDINDTDNVLPTEFVLNQNFPNPFNPTTKISYSIPKTSPVEITVFDLLGNKIVKLVDEVKSPGNYEINFDAAELSSGIYFYRLQSNEIIRTKKLMLIK